jgi:maltose-binding protein MalE
MQSADIGVLASNGYLQPLEWLDDATRARFYEIGFDAMKYDGINYGVGYSIDAYGIVYNKALISEIPATWSEYFVKAKKLTQKNGDEITLYGTQIAPNNYWMIYPLIRNEGGYFFGNIPIVERNFSLVLILIIFVSMLPAGITYLSETRKKRREMSAE